MKLLASADRRPVDPPPVVQLRIFETDPDDSEHGEDITFPYNANFVLYASIKSARAIAQPRGTGTERERVPVLTGVPVAAIAYLDRPEPAGYFIFPDLSVRHEGRYQLNFHLYEEVKENKDADIDGPRRLGSVSSSSNPRTPQTYLNFRVQVDSDTFTVFSAKKFPGLHASTSLSRCIAEQGCRVRIRRDVRMRRRGEKRHKEDFDFGDALFPRPNKYFTPDPYGPAASPIERPRSSRSSTVDTPMAYTPDLQRRPSIPEYGPQYAQPLPRRMVPAPPAAWAHVPPYQPYQSHLAFGSGQFQGPQLPPTPPPVAPAMPYSPQVASAVSYSPQMPYYHARHRSSVSEYEPNSTGYASHQPPIPAEPPSYAKVPEVTRQLQPLKPLVTQPYPEAHSADSSANQSATPTTVSSPPMKLPPCKEILSHPPSSISSSPAFDPRARLYETENSLTKRSHEESFGRDDRRLFNGMRPDSSTYPDSIRKGSFPFMPLPNKMEGEYRRANGSTRTRLI